jgi:hypothetical protein
MPDSSAYLLQKRAQPSDIDETGGRIGERRLQQDVVRFVLA